MLFILHWPCTVSGHQIDENARKSKKIVIITSHNRYVEIVFPSGFALKMGWSFSTLITHQNDAPSWCSHCLK
ncbi:hypothetical protein CQA65_12340 [Klebsiella pneumoniae]|nr:hypothetical protein CQA22_23075 [Klebsiella pneumoniae]PCR08468.1 hypothetical protein CQA72_14890 [Klebsiella pneumoniae]PCR15646.1 hypothetical protein CQA67_04305 [Klebsiella pneumoniae]PCR19307.1 hypothetical protein CQA65_12340 [Klebsiella pneumoniae]